MNKRLFDDSRLELLRRITNQAFPEKPVNSIEEIKKIIINEERKRGVSVKEHNRQELEIQLADYVLD